MINDLKKNHEEIKKEIVDNTYLIDELEIKINTLISKLTEAEVKYVTLIEELNNRENAI
jgi:hypothetical protein